MLKVGLTGGIGSGKSVVAGIFEVLGIPVYYADAAAREIMESDTETIHAVKALFGEQAYLNEMLNRTLLAESIFKNPSLRQALNELVHPKTIAHAEAWFKEQKSPFAIKEAALIFESGSEKKLDIVIGVSAPLEIKLKRILKRDGIDASAAMKRINSQMDEAEKMNRCDFIILNNEMELLIPQVEHIYKELISRVASA